MPIFERDQVRISYQVHGEGLPVLALAPGGLRSVASRWESAPWNPVAALSESYQVITMDQRNAGDSWAPITAEDGWHTYTDDQIGLMDHLGFHKFYVIGMCIGGPYATRICQQAANRILAAVLLQPIGLEHNRHLFEGMVDSWREDIADAHPEAGDEAWAAFKKAMFGGRFMFAVDKRDLSKVETPTLVAMGDDEYHPASVSRAVARLTPNATLIEEWKDEAHLPALDSAIKDLFEANVL
jgi:pimeloyl-ACP methyl ester carboxylesterase